MVPRPSPTTIDTPLTRGRSLSRPPTTPLSSSWKPLPLPNLPTLPTVAGVHAVTNITATNQAVTAAETPVPSLHHGVSFNGKTLPKRPPLILPPPSTSTSDPPVTQTSLPALPALAATATASTCATIPSYGTDPPPMCDATPRADSLMAKAAPCAATGRSPTDATWSTNLPSTSALAVVKPGTELRRAIELRSVQALTPYNSEAWQRWLTATGLFP